ncbi:hypothetical protein [Mycetocola miduiensis]|uniref:hypothetical protein n=1 Tax=Mycetocola miduiensis TaxID=995034 RepID=UPI0015A5910F|nr:hypothetical protein [Mycetocola miduiensis]
MYSSSTLSWPEELHKTMIHAHAPSRDAISAAVEKIQGLSGFTGTFNENVWCDTFGTRL